jgi:hypothetical protein
MRTKLRIRPRFWQASPELRPRWRWLPLSLVFRMQRMAVRSTQKAPRSLVSSSTSFSIIARHSHFHINEGSRSLTHTIQKDTLIFTRPQIQHPAAGNNSGWPVTNSLNIASIRERHIETHLHVRRVPEKRRTFLSTDRLTRVINEVFSHPASLGTGSAEGRILTPAHRRKVQPVFFRPRTSSLALSKPLPLSGRAEAIRTQRVESLMEHRPAPQLRIADRPMVEPIRTESATPSSVKQVWRRTQLRSPDLSSESATRSSISKSVPAGSKVSYKVDPPIGAASPAPTAFKLEGPVMDRLAEDVMKRIERHLRIERERRGM